MWELIQTNQKALGAAVGIHLLLLLVMFFGVNWTDDAKPLPATPVVQATVVDQAALDKEVKKLKAAEDKKRKQKEAAEKKKKAEAKRKAEAERKAAEKKKQEAAKKKRLAEEKKKKAAAEKKRLAEEKKQKAAAEKQRKAEEAAKKAAAEKKRQAEEAALKKAEAEKKKAEAAARQLELEAQYQAEQDLTEKQLIMAAIQQKVDRNWLRPPGTPQNLSCEVRVRLGANGSVLLVSIIKSSGDVGFDRSVESAVSKADPLPMPTSPRLVSQFRDIRFVFKPSS
ncbi:MAG: cell envelope integrity protein TolA [Sedimenticolaceae bacterium]